MIKKSLLESWALAAIASCAAVTGALAAAATGGPSGGGGGVFARFGFRFFSAAAEGTSASSAARVRLFNKRLASFKRSRSGSSSRFRRFFDSDLRLRLFLFSFSRLRFFLSWLDDEEESEEEDDDDEAARPMASRTRGRWPTQTVRATRLREGRLPDAIAGSRSSTRGRAVRADGDGHQQAGFFQPSYPR